MFWNKKKKTISSENIEDQEATGESLPQLGDDDPIWLTPGPRSQNEVDDSVNYVDMGSLKVPAIQGMQVRAQVGEDKTTVMRVLLVLGSSGIQVALAAAPKSGGVWDELRGHITDSLKEGGAEIEENKGRYGTEITAHVPEQMPDGSVAKTTMRIIGAEGDRWFARIDILGPAAVDESQRAQVERIIDSLVVVRDDAPRVRMDMLPLHIPEGAETLADN